VVAFKKEEGKNSAQAKVSIKAITRQQLYSLKNWV
jgi:hypothetical protein